MASGLTLTAQLGEHHTITLTNASLSNEAVIIGEIQGPKVNQSITFRSHHNKYFDGQMLILPMMETKQIFIGEYQYDNIGHRIMICVADCSDTVWYSHVMLGATLGDYDCMFKVVVPA